MSYENAEQLKGVVIADLKDRDHWFQDPQIHQSDVFMAGQTLFSFD